MRYAGLNIDGIVRSQDKVLELLSQISLQCSISASANSYRLDSQGPEIVRKRTGVEVWALICWHKRSH